MPSIAIASVDLGAGVVALSDGSLWQVGPGDLLTVASWVAGRPAAVATERLTREVVYEDDGSRARVCPASRASPGARRERNDGTEKESPRPPAGVADADEDLLPPAAQGAHAGRLQGRVRAGLPR